MNGTCKSKRAEGQGFSVQPTPYSSTVLKQPDFTARCMYHQQLQKYACRVLKTASIGFKSKPLSQKFSFVFGLSRETITCCG